jgi:hypothetical protein
MNAVILQPSYIPWRGYFHQIFKADVFVFYDDVQYDKHGWRNRNRIRSTHGSMWLTVPVHAHGNISQGISVRDIEIDWNRAWNRKHWQTLQQSYGRAPYFSAYAEMLERFYTIEQRYLADFTIESTMALCRTLGISKTRFIRSSTLNVAGERTGRLVSILQAVGCDHYISGPSAKEYLNERTLVDAGVTLEYMTYDYPEYPQVATPFDPHVSILDLLFMTGPEAPKYIWGGSGGNEPDSIQ